MSIKQANEFQKVVDSLRENGYSDVSIQFHLKALFSKMFAAKSKVINKNIAPVQVAKKSVVHDAQKKERGVIKVAPRTFLERIKFVVTNNRKR